MQLVCCRSMHRTRARGLGCHMWGMVNAADQSIGMTSSSLGKSNAAQRSSQRQTVVTFTKQFEVDAGKCPIHAQVQHVNKLAPPDLLCSVQAQRRRLCKRRRTNAGCRCGRNRWTLARTPWATSATWSRSPSKLAFCCSRVHHMQPPDKSLKFAGTSATARLGP